MFDKKLLAKSAEVGAEWSVKVNMDCITLDGDLCASKGSLTGGYTDPQKSRLRAYAAQVEAEREFKECDSEWRKAHEAAKQAEQDVANASDGVSSLKNKQAQLSRNVASMEMDSKYCTAS